MAMNVVASRTVGVQDGTTPSLVIVPAAVALGCSDTADFYRTLDDSKPLRKRSGAEPERYRKHCYRRVRELVS